MWFEWCILFVTYSGTEIGNTSVITERNSYSRWCVPRFFLLASVRTAICYLCHFVFIAAPFYFINGMKFWQLRNGFSEFSTTFSAYGAGLCRHLATKVEQVYFRDDHLFIADGLVLRNFRLHGLFCKFYKCFYCAFRLFLISMNASCFSLLIQLCVLSVLFTTRVTVA